MNAEIIAVGSELLLGQIANTNGQYISERLAELGINVFFHTVVGDNASRLEDSIKIAKGRADLVILTGGLGPTMDDLTKETISSLLSTPLVYDEESLTYIENYFKVTNREMTENNKKQALVLEGAQILKNDHGMAPGMALKKEGTTYILLPGPPKEMKPMFHSYAVPFLSNAKNEGMIVSRVLRFFGIGESILETKVQDLIDAQTNPTIAPLAGDGEVTLRLTAKCATEKEAQEKMDVVEMEIRARVGEYLYGYGTEGLPQVTVKALKKGNITVASAESLTGGLFAKEITAISGASEIYKSGYITYTNEAKQSLLNVSEETIRKHGAVSRECAKEMAEQARLILKSDYGISFTGVAGPEPSEGKKPGTVYIGIASEKGTDVYELNLSGTRNAIQVRSVKYGLFYLGKMIGAF